MPPIMDSDDRQSLGGESTVYHELLDVENLLEAYFRFVAPHPHAPIPTPTSTAAVPASMTAPCLTQLPAALAWSHV